MAATLQRRFVWSTPLRTRFRALDVRDGVLLRGDAGWGELSPFWDYDDAESLAWLRAAREAADVGFPPAVRDRVPVNVTVPAVGPERAREIVLASGGCRTAKVKVAQLLADGTLEPLHAEVERLEAVRAAFVEAGVPDAAVRIDANGAWDVDDAVRRIARLDAASGGLEYVEQPCADVAGLAAVRRRVDVPVAADESIRRAADPLRVVREEAADVVVLKVQPLGGVRACLDLAEQVGLPVVVSSALESSVGLAAGVALAAALPALPYACGLATSQLLVHDVTAEPLLPVDGALPLRPVAPDAAALAAAVPPPDVEARWLARHDRLEALLAETGRAA
ncbi:Muconate cycloisomerase 1 [Isoptericola dokdonensis DS-3]|uniref:o-succinylbenzoate synthase n=1 Tax=Isoptericola dokdonensis DS-3 TaxID=1300344 RepID=A0A168FBI9_9MICO|nr:o-succinylbenzoate synthase [Isoptericola dokdonensis]ANC31276.1 Muconate cycloisomerase 1 [Isoptericola dokdonensis DS-3]